MALKIWLPLNGTLENKGVSDFTITNNGAAIDNSGKIGKCYYFDGSTYINGSGINYTSLSIHFSVSLWIKFHETVSSYTEILSLAPTAGWAKIRFGMVVPSNSTVISCSVADGTNYLGNSFQTSSIPLDTWTHVCFIYNNKNLELYIDGDFLKSYSTSIVPDWENISTIGIGAAANGGEKSKCYINDVRIYDHALSTKEVKEISQGLVIHYKLDDNIQTLNNCYSYPTFNTSVGNGGWNHWGRSGHVGNQGQNTDKTYIYNKQNTYSHWVSNGSTATGEYLVYQSPAFDGGYRSLQVIIKEEESRPIPITGEICFPAWNARNGGTAAHTWTSITSLGDGFYLCKCEGISQDGSDDLVGIYVKPGYKIYISEAYLENDKEMCSEILFPRNYIIDSSGYDNNGVITGILETNTSDRYLVSTKFPTNTCYIKLPEITYSNFGNSYTFSWWEYMTTVDSQPMPWGFSDGNRLNFYHATNLCWNTGDGGNNTFTPKKTSASLVDNKWHHIAITGNGTAVQLYIDGVNVGKATTYKALTGIQIYISGWNTGTYYKMTGNSMSDFRIYATALSAEDVLDLYHTPASIDNFSNAHAFEFIEDDSAINVEKNGIFKNKWSEGLELKTLSDGSIWAKIFYFDYDEAGAVWTTEEAKWCSKKGKYSCLGDLEKFIPESGWYEFWYTEQASGSKFIRWKQSYNPLSRVTSGTSGTSSEYQFIDGTSVSSFTGLTRFKQEDDQYCYLRGYPTWWGAIAPYQTNYDVFPSMWGGSTGNHYQELWINITENQNISKLNSNGQSISLIEK